MKTKLSIIVAVLAFAAIISVVANFAGPSGHPVPQVAGGSQLP